MIEIDGSYGEGGGQILRTSLSLSCMLQKPFRICNIRKSRKKPGLMPQHLACVRALKKICDAKVRGDEQGSGELVFEPAQTRPGEYFFDIGTAGSTSLLLQAILPPLAFADTQSRLVLRGGTHVPFSPSFHHIGEVFVPVLAECGMNLDVSIEKYGFYPKGGGEIIVHVTPTRDVQSLELQKRGEIKDIRGLSSVGNLPLDIAERQKKAAIRVLSSVEPMVTVDTMSVDAIGQGTFIFLKIEGERCYAGASAIGARGKRAEAVGEEAARYLRRFIETSACLDEHTADQIVLYLAMAESNSVFTTSRVTRHLMTNLAVIERFKNVTCTVEGGPGAGATVSISVDH